MNPIIIMSVVLACCSNEPYLGMDADCTKQATICLSHSPHTDKNGILHNILPLSHFRRTVNELKFQMIDKVANLTDQYTTFMDLLISQIQDLKARKVIELGTLWLRELSSSQEEYEQLKRILRNDFQGFSCRQINNFYQKITHTHELQQQKLQNIPAYEGICQVMQNLSKSVKSRLLITERLTNLQGVLQKGQLLKKALPQLRIMQEGGKEILLDDRNKNYEIRYNRAEVKESSKGYQSVLSKYPLITLNNYFVKLNCKYTNVIIGVGRQKLKNSSQNQTDLHYSQHSLTYNCSNGYIYRDGMFQSGLSNLLKGKKTLDLVLQITSTEMLLMMGKSLICRTPLKQFQGKHLYLHILMRTKSDSAEISVHADQQTGRGLPIGQMGESSALLSESKEQSIVQQSISLKQSQYEMNYNEKSSPEFIKVQEGESENQLQVSLGKNFGNRHKPKQKSISVQNAPVYESQYQPKVEDSFEMPAKFLQGLANKPLIESIRDKDIIRPAQLNRNDKSNVLIHVQSSYFGSEAQPSSRNSRPRKQSSRIVFNEDLVGSLTGTQLDDKFAKMVGEGPSPSKKRYLGLG